MFFEQLLLAVDGSDHSNRAVDLAADLAGHYESEVVLMHVVHMPTGPVPKGLELYEQIEHVHLTSMEIREAEAGWIVQEAERRLRELGVAKVSTRIEFGHPVAVLVDYAAHHLTDGGAIVMGRRGLGDFRGLVLGSVSHRVSHLADCTVVTVQ